MDNKVLTEKVREAIKRNDLLSFRFYEDGSGAQFNIYDPTGDHGLPCDWCISLPIDNAIDVLSGKWINIKRK